MSASELDVLVCPACEGGLLSQNGGEALHCAREDHRYVVRDGIPVLLTEGDELERRYRRAYDELARDDLEEPLESDRTVRHAALVDFIGNVKARRLLDIGSSTGAYLSRVNAGTRVALDIALPSLLAMPAQPGLVRVCADAQRLPFPAQTFDVVVLSGVLEHVLDARAVVDEVGRVCTPDAHIFVYVPWEEDLAAYADSEYEFTHLRSFNSWSFANLWSAFYIRRRRGNYPRLTDPLPFRIIDHLPDRLRGLVSYAYFHSKMPKREYERRARWIAELPRRERWLLKLYPPIFMMLELTPLSNARPFRLRAAASRWSSRLRGLLRRHNPR